MASLTKARTHTSAFATHCRHLAAKGELQLQLSLSKLQTPLCSGASGKARQHAGPSTSKARRPLCAAVARYQPLRANVLSTLPRPCQCIACSSTSQGKRKCSSSESKNPSAFIHCMPSGRGGGALINGGVQMSRGRHMPVPPAKAQTHRALGCCDTAHT